MLAVGNSKFGSPAPLTPSVLRRALFAFSGVLKDSLTPLNGLAVLHYRLKQYRPGKGVVGFPDLVLIQLNIGGKSENFC